MNRREFMKMVGAVVAGLGVSGGAVAGLKMEVGAVYGGWWTGDHVITADCLRVMRDGKVYADGRYVGYCDAKRWKFVARRVIEFEQYPDAPRTVTLPSVENIPPGLQYVIHCAVQR